jgi:hypothetical protein
MGAAMGVVAARTSGSWADEDGIKFGDELNAYEANRYLRQPYSHLMGSTTPPLGGRPEVAELKLCQVALPKLGRKYIVKSFTN